VQALFLTKCALRFVRLRCSLATYKYVYMLKLRLVQVFFLEKSKKIVQAVRVYTAGPIHF